MRGSRAASGAGGAADSTRGPSRIQIAAATAATSITPGERVQRRRATPAAEASGGSVNDAIAAPAGTAVWRRPSASPRSSRGNQPNTARPLAAIPAEPSIPASAIHTSSATYPCELAAANIASDPPPSPAAMIARSPRASEATPQASSVTTVPTREGGEHGRDLDEREVECVLDRRRHRGQPALHGRQRGGRERAHAEHHPAIGRRLHAFESAAPLDGRDRVPLGRPDAVARRVRREAPHQLARAGRPAGRPRRSRARTRGAGCRSPRCTRRAAPRSARARSSSSSIAWSWL